MQEPRPIPHYSRAAGERVLLTAAILRARMEERRAMERLRDTALDHYGDLPHPVAMALDGLDKARAALATLEGART